MPAILAWEVFRYGRSIKHGHRPQLKAGCFNHSVRNPRSVVNEQPSKLAAHAAYLSHYQG